VSGFSLWTEAWIPVEDLDGRLRKVSLPEALSQAHLLRGISDPSPLITVALHRLLLAVVLRTHRLANSADWERLWNAGRFDSEAIAAYGRGREEQFDLLHPTRPFYQVPFMPGEKVHPVAALALEAASGNNPALFDHGLVEGDTVLPLDRAACYLLAHQAFAVRGGVSKPFNRMDAPLTKGFIVEIVGRNLFETLALNVMTRQYWDQVTPVIDDDRPFWEEHNPPEPVKEGTVVRGPLHYLTWQSRQIHLIVDQERRVVTGCQIAQRYCLPKDGRRVDPGKCYVKAEDKREEGWQPRRLQKDRAAWRLTHVLLQSALGDKDSTLVLTWLAALRQREKQLGTIQLPRTVSLAVSGLTTDPKRAAKIELWRREEIHLPLTILDDPDLVKRVWTLMEDAAWVESLLRRSTEALFWALAERHQLRVAVNYLHLGRRAKVQVPAEAANVARGDGVLLRYWAAMEAPFRKALFELPEKSFDQVRSEWHERLRQNARAAFAVTLNAQRAAGAPWEILSVIHDGFGRRIARIPADREEETDDDRNDG